ncbi:MAG: hypothetical protein KA603_09545 [Azonexus sp.]|jgi:hypothetical protein|nr:hypothetical protein [Betaproteobacteria bacterium]MBK8918008.1 hypothetical protein [Betaproteobacteria bacterium]MBP6036363.1 hypothetical protein [Azonexus sp.]MBP6906972.1 hypothetical protein [Azonexus sp.]
MSSPLFIDDSAVSAALDAAADHALQALLPLIAELGGPRGSKAREAVRAALLDSLRGQDGDPPLIHGEDAFGHPFRLEDLPLPRASVGYGVQRLDTDFLLDRRSGDFLPVRDPRLDAGFSSFAEARGAARAWVVRHGNLPEDRPLAIVPVGYDEALQRPILIYGVLPASPD